MNPGSPKLGATRRFKPDVDAEMVMGGARGIGDTGGVVVTVCEGIPGVEAMGCGGIVNGPMQRTLDGIQSFGTGIAGVMTLCGGIAGVCTAHEGIFGVDSPGTV
jgi:hypothetical protein